MQRRQLIKGLAAGAIVSTLLPAFAAEPVTLKVGASPLVTGDILEFVKPALAKKGINLKIIEFTDYILPPFVGSLGIVMVSPFFNSLTSLIFLE